MSRRGTHLGDVRAAQVCSVGEEEATKTPGQKGQEAGSKWHRPEVGGGPGRNAGSAPAWQRPWGAEGSEPREEPAGGEEGRTAQELASKKALTHFIQREVKASGDKGLVQGHSQSVWQSQDRNPRLLTLSVYLHAPINKCLLRSISEVIKAEAEQSTLCWKKELKKENSPGRNSGSSCSGATVWPGFQLRVQTSKCWTKKLTLSKLN